MTLTGRGPVSGARTSRFMENALTGPVMSTASAFSVRVLAEILSRSDCEMPRTLGPSAPPRRRLTLLAACGMTVRLLKKLNDVTSKLSAVIVALPLICVEEPAKVPIVSNWPGALVNVKLPLKVLAPRVPTMLCCGRNTSPNVL
jgi:hypothetical protein